MKGSMHLRGARTNNLKNISVDFPLKKFTVVTGLSGSGKSSLVFDTLYAEGQRRYVESLSTYTRQFLEKMPKPDIDSLDNVSPAIALEQKNHINNSRSTVATMSELYDYFRLLYAKVGHTFCLKCGKEVLSDNPTTVAQSLARLGAGTRFYVLSVIDEIGVTKKTWPDTRKALLASGFQRVATSANGKDEVHELNELEKLPVKLKAAYLVVDRMALPDQPTKDSRLMDALDQAFQHGVGRVAIAVVDKTDAPSIGKRYDDLTAEEKKLLWDGDGTKKFPGIRGCFDELKAWKYKLHVRVFIRRYQMQKLCGECQGSRLRLESRAVKLGPEGNRRNLAELLALPIEQANVWFRDLTLPRQEAAIAKDAIKQINGRLEFLVDVGVGYLTLNRLGKTLSGGECQRINLATQLGNKLCSTLYVLDEPSIGLHPADTEKLISLLHKLRDHGNTLIVVEHDLDVIASADHIVEIGPHAGHRGGEVVAAGPIDAILDDKGCLTAKYLTGTFTVPKRDRRRPLTGKALKIAGACENNLKDVTVEFPLHQLVAITGLSGSGKTTLVHRTLHNALARLFHKENLPVGKFQRLYGADLVHDVVLLDQRPIGRSARSNPATYLKIYDDIRTVMANQSLSVRRGYTPGFFSFNVDGGRCPTCKGEGEITLDMHFMADVKLPCEECEGRKFKKSVLEVEYKKMRNVGLGYLELGQSSTTLSGGESQRLKIASVLTEGHETNMLYIFDEPTTGLHVDDVKRLLRVMHDLVDGRNTVLVIEHNLELISQADWIIDMGPGGGSHGGLVVAAGTPEDVMANPDSLTGKFLRKIEESPSRRILPNVGAQQPALL
ncbi:MAG: excinuclease ABC subunit UvrA [Deltaproteobacteria bacterium]|nr:excinuclease ABC subunit UvrA [Deltaproteobacteria bacterium]